MQKKRQAILISSLIQITAITAMIYFVNDGFNLSFFISFTASLVCINLAFLYQNHLIRALNLIILSIFILQLVNYTFTADYIVTETLFNLPSYNEIETSSVIKAILGLIFCFFLWIPNILFPFIKKSTRNSFIAAFIVLISILLPSISSLREPIIEIHTILSSKTFFDIEMAKEFERDRISTGKCPIDSKGFNVILIFAEGTSRRVIRPDITPNTYELLGNSFCVDNYFCHTAPTYRGVRGQLISGYQQNGIYIGDRIAMNPKLSSIPMLQTILEKEGYKTCFVSPDLKDDAFNSMITKLSFQKVIIDEKLTEIQSDRDTYEALFKAADEYEKANERFLICTYIQGTHVYLDSPHEKYKDGKDACLNKFYNQDYWFGEFIKKMKASNYFDNTLLIFTADHSTYPTPDFNKAFGSEHGSFVDTVPLFIYKNGIIPQHFDAKNRNSLALTPTILNILGIENHKNYFLGNSLFSEEKSPFQNLSVRESLIIDTSSGKPRQKLSPPEPLLNKIRNYYKLFG